MIDLQPSASSAHEPARLVVSLAPRPLRWRAPLLCGLPWLATVACTSPRFDSPMEGTDAAPPATAEVAPPKDAASKPDVVGNVPLSAPEAGTGSPRDAHAASSSEGGVEDAAVALTPQLQPQSDPAQPLVGTYALQVRMFGRDPAVPGSWFAEERIHLAAISRDPTSGQLVMTAQLCRDLTESRLPLVEKGVAVLVHPERVPERRFELVLEGEGRFSTTGVPSYWGYDPTTPAGCTRGASVKAPEPRSWLPNNECTCPLSDAAPTTTRDCRVTDGDGDMNPGVTVQQTGFFERLDFVRAKDDGQLVSGMVAADQRHSAHYRRVDDYYELTCRGDGCSNTAYTECPPELNPVRFEPLTQRAGQPWGCGDVLREVEAGKLFPREPAALPAGC